MASEKQKFKRNRTRTYFLQAARDMISSEGVENVTVRKIADISGYSYPTLYNYFKDLNALLWETKRFMILGIVEAMRQKVRDPLKGPEDVKSAFKAYIQYYLENPNIFKFFYFYPVRKPDGESEDSPMEPDFGVMWNEAFRWLVLNGRIQEKEIEVIAKTLIYAIHGMLMLGFSNNGDLCEEDNLHRDLDKMVDFLLNHAQAQS